MTSILRASTLTLAGVGIIAAGAFAASPASAHEGEDAHPKAFKRMAHFQSEGKAWQSVLNPEHIEHVAEKLEMGVEDLEALLETEEGREEVHTQMEAIHEAHKQEMLESMAVQLDMTVEELEAAKEDPELRAQIREKMEELDIAPPEAPGHPRNFGQFQKRMNHFENHQNN